MVCKLTELRFSDGEDDYSLLIDSDDPNKANGYVWIGGNFEKGIPLAGEFLQISPGHWVNKEIDQEFKYDAGASK